MGVSDSEISLSKVDCTCTVYDGGVNSLVISMVQTDVESTVEGDKYTEAKARDLHVSGTPIIRKIGEGNVTGSMSCLVSSFAGSTAVTPYEAFTMSGLAASWTSTARGDRKALKIALDINASGSSGATQRIAYNYCVISNVSVSPSGGEGLFMLSFDFVDHETKPTIT